MSHVSKKRVLLTNGRFPVAIDLARQLHRGGCVVYCVDPMEYHMCKFSSCVKKSYQVPAPHIDAEGYVKGVRKAIDKHDIEVIVPIHEEIFYLAECTDEEILKRLLAPPFETLIMLHNKWEFIRFLSRIGLDHPESHLIRKREDLNELGLKGKEWALKPVYGRATANVFHLKPNKEVPDFPVGDDDEYIAQEWIKGNRYCSYSVVRNGKIQSFGLYPVQDTIDGSSCVYFEAVEHDAIRRYVEKVAAALPSTSGQLAFDFIETPDRLVAIECNPRSTSGVHLYSGTPHLAKALIDPNCLDQPTLSANLGAHRQVAPGMLMWKADKSRKAREQMPLRKQYLQHMKRHLTTKDVMFSKKDLIPTLVQPFLLTSYYEICRERKMKLPVMFQWDLSWEPTGDHLRRIKKMLEETATGEPRIAANGNAAK